MCPDERLTRNWKELIMSEYNLVIIIYKRNHVNVWKWSLTEYSIKPLESACRD